MGQKRCDWSNAVKAPRGHCTRCLAGKQRVSLWAQLTRKGSADRTSALGSPILNNTFTFRVRYDSTSHQIIGVATQMRRSGFTACRRSVLAEKRWQVRDGLQKALGVHRLVRRKRFELVIQQKRHDPAVKTAAETTAAAEQERIQTRNCAPRGGGGRGGGGLSTGAELRAHTRENKKQKNFVLRY